MTRLEYIWLDGHEEQNLRSKARFVDHPIRSVEDCPCWGFDGSSTEQAKGNHSDCILRPVKMYKNPLNEFSGSSYLVLCEVDNMDGTPHRTNHRRKLIDLVDETAKYDMWFGIEQEYVMIDTNTAWPVGWPAGRSYPRPQGDYYCGVGDNNIKLERLVNEHAEACINADINIHGTNAEVMLSQCEYQIGTEDAVNISDDLWITRYLLYKISAFYGVTPMFHPKPVKGDWNGSGAHINFSTREMREEWCMEDLHDFCSKMGEYANEMIVTYGKDNDLRLTGKHETAHIDDYSYGVSDRGSSIRIPYSVAAAGGRGYLEDRRPAANMNPYLAVASLVKYTSSVVEKMEQDSTIA